MGRAFFAGRSNGEVERVEDSKFSSKMLNEGGGRCLEGGSFIDFFSRTINEKRAWEIFWKIGTARRSRHALDYSGNICDDRWVLKMTGFPDYLL